MTTLDPLLLPGCYKGIGWTGFFFNLLPEILGGDTGFQAAKLTSGSGLKCNKTHSHTKHPLMWYLTEAKAVMSSPVQMLTGRLTISILLTPAKRAVEKGHEGAEQKREGERGPRGSDGHGDCLARSRCRREVVVLLLAEAINTHVCHKPFYRSICRRQSERVNANVRMCVCACVCVDGVMYEQRQSAS